MEVLCSDSWKRAIPYLLLCNRTASVFKGLERIEKKDYPEEALREALLNAIVHPGLQLQWQYHY